MASHDAALIAIQGPFEGLYFQLTDEGVPLVVGRGGGGALRLGDNNCSRRHAQFLLDDNGWNVEDLLSRNGTYVNGERIFKRTPISEGDHVILGSSIFKVSKSTQQTVVAPVTQFVPPPSDNEATLQAAPIEALALDGDAEPAGDATIRALDDQTSDDMLIDQDPLPGDRLAANSMSVTDEADAIGNTGGRLATVESQKAMELDDELSIDDQPVNGGIPIGDQDDLDLPTDRHAPDEQLDEPPEVATRGSSADEDVLPMLDRDDDSGTASDGHSLATPSQATTQVAGVKVIAEPAATVVSTETTDETATESNIPSPVVVGDATPVAKRPDTAEFDSSSDSVHADTLLSDQAAISDKATVLDEATAIPSVEQVDKAGGPDVQSEPLNVAQQDLQLTEDSIEGSDGESDITRVKDTGSQEMSATPSAAPRAALSATSSADVPVARLRLATDDEPIEAREVAIEEPQGSGSGLSPDETVHDDVASGDEDGIPNEPANQTTSQSINQTPDDAATHADQDDYDQGRNASDAEPTVQSPTQAQARNQDPDKDPGQVKEPVGAPGREHTTAQPQDRSTQTLSNSQRQALAARLAAPLPTRADPLTAIAKPATEEANAASAPNAKRDSTDRSPAENDPDKDEPKAEEAAAMEWMLAIDREMLSRVIDEDEREQDEPNAEGGDVSAQSNEAGRDK